MVQVRVPVCWFLVEACLQRAVAVDVDVDIQEVDHVFSVFTLKLDGAVERVDFLKEIKKGGFAPCPDHKNIIFKSGVGHVLPVDSGIDMAGFEIPHENIGIGAGALAAHRAAFGLEVVSVIEDEVVEKEGHREEFQEDPCWN